jgi:hypothetical protein
LVGQRIGSELTAPIDPEVVTSGIASTVLAGMPARSAMPDGRDLSGDLPELSGISSVTDDFDVQVIVVAIDVIARSGVKGASMIRVARRAQVSTGSPAAWRRASKRATTSSSRRAPTCEASRWTSFPHCATSSMRSESVLRCCTTRACPWSSSTTPAQR